MNLATTIKIYGGGSGSGPSAPCPQCGPEKRGMKTQVQDVLRNEPDRWFRHRSLQERLGRTYIPVGKISVSLIERKKVGREAFVKWRGQNNPGESLPVRKEVNITPQEKQLSTAEIASAKDNDRHGVNESSWVVFKDGSQALLKPYSGEDAALRLDSINQFKGAQGLRERAAFALAKVFGMEDLVPAVVERTVNGQKGVLIDFKQGKEATVANDPYDGIEDEQRAAAFDVVLGNTDRHTGNWLVGPGGKLVLIDHGLTLPDKASRAHDVRSRFLDHLRGVPISKDIINTFVSKKDEVRATLKDLGFNQVAVQQTEKRLSILAKASTWQDVLRAT